jgi:hypothetical protein
VTRLTGRATDVDIVVTERMTAVACLDALGSVDLLRFDAVVLSVGINEALALRGSDAWERDLTALLDRLGRDTAAATRTFVLSIPLTGVGSDVPAPLSRVLDRRIRSLNDVTRRLLEQRSDTVFVVFEPVDAYELEGTHAYQKWASEVADQVAPTLDLLLEGGSRAHVDDEAERLGAVSTMGTPTDTDAVLDCITASARACFGTQFAAITLVQEDTQQVLSAAGIGMRRVPLPRSESFCDVTIRRNSAFVIEDAARDPRYAHYGTVAGGPGIRFYAGYPIESPDGHRVGALCLLDARPRQFTPSEAALLRLLAHKAQKHIWAGV